MKCCWNYLGNSRVHVVVPRGLRLLPSAPFTLYVCLSINDDLGSSLSKYAFDIQEMVVPVSNKDAVLFLLIVTGKCVAYFVLHNLTSIILPSHDSHSESEEEWSMLSGLSESQCSLLLLGSDVVLLDVHVELITSLISSLLLLDLHLCLSA